MTTATQPPTPSSVRTGPAIAVLLVSAFIVVLNETAMGVSIPHIMEGFGVSAASAQWLTTAFMLTMAVVIPVTGVLLQRYTLRRNFFTAMGLFAVGSAVAAFAPTFDVLLVARVVQALGTSIMLPMLFTTVMQLVAAEKRGRTMGLVAIVTAAAPALGPTVSGVIVSSLGWQWVFILVLLHRGPRDRRRSGVVAECDSDDACPPASTSSPCCCLPSASPASSTGWRASGSRQGARAVFPIWVPLSIGVVALVALVVRQLALRETDRVLLDVRVFTGRLFTVSTVIDVTVSMSLFGSLILLPLYGSRCSASPHTSPASCCCRAVSSPASSPRSSAWCTTRSARAS